MANLDGDPFQTQLFGTKAGATVKGWGENPIEIYTEQNRQLFNMRPTNVPNVESSHVDEIKAFIDAIIHNMPSPVPGENGLILNAIFDALYKSSETGNEEKVDISY
jgi:predicted dehydrogenase